jgi:ribosomal protein L11 methyltransferase
MSSKLPATPIATLITDEQSVRRIAAVISETYDGDDVAVTLVDAGAGRWRVAIHFRHPPDKKSLRALTASAAGAAAAKALHFDLVEAADWVRDSLAGLAPVRAGRFIVHGAHDRTGIPANRVGIEIEAALAFGTGHHGTTRGCLLALDRLCEVLSKPRPVDRYPEVRAEGKPRRTHGGAAGAVTLRGSSLRAEHLRVTERKPILDLGTGSGVLAIAAARALHRRVLATDIDLSAVHVARANARLNRVGALVEVVNADGVAAPSLRRQAPFDLIFANILLGPLLRLAAPLRQLTARGGRIVLSGIVPAQANAVIAAYRPFVLERRLNLDGWTTLVFVRRARNSLSVAGRVGAS